MRALPVIAVALLVCSAVVGATGGLSASVADDPAAGVDGADDAVTPAPERDGSSPAAIRAPVAQADGNGSVRQQINVLDTPPGSVERWNIQRQYVDLGPAVGLSTNATTDRLRTLAMVERVEGANTTEERQERLRTALRDLEARVDELDRRQTAAIRAYGQREIESRELLVALGRINIAADERSERGGRMEDLADSTGGFDFGRGRLASIGNRLSAFRGPVRSRVEAVLRGEAAPHRFYLSTGPESVTVSTVLDDAYLREAYRGDLRNGAGDAIELEVALDIVAASYPVIWNTTREQTQVFGGGEVYPVRIAHSRGDLTAFVDSDARVVYAEHQRRPLASVAPDQRVQRTGDGLRIVVNQTYPGGPSQIRVVDAETGDPVEATVSMTVGTGDAERLGTTDEAGTLWTLSPYRRYTVAVEGRDGAVNATVDPGTPPRVETNPGAGANDGNDTATPTPTSTPTPTASAVDADVYIR
jgi:hypothetical protein